MERWQQTLGLASRAGFVKHGDGVLPTVKGKKAKVVLLATDASDNTKKKINDKCKTYDVLVIEKYTTDQISNAIGKDNRKYVSITDKAFAQKIIDYTK